MASPPTTALTPSSHSGPETWPFLKSLVLDALPSAHSRRAYGQALEAFRQWCSENQTGPFNKAIVQRYRAALEARALAPSSINVALSAIRKLASEAADNGLATTDFAAAIGRVKGAKRHGVRTGNWLSKTQAEQLLALPCPGTLKGLRDRALLGLLIGCGLRREELASLTIEEIQLRDARWVLVDLAGKGKRIRTVPMPNWAKRAIDEWTVGAGISGGRLLRPVNKGGRITGESMTAQSIFAVVAGYSRQLGLSIAPHDLRRTFAKLAHQGHAAIEQIQISLGHASIQTTERYLGIQQDLTDAPCDHLGLLV